MRSNLVKKNRRFETGRRRGIPQDPSPSAPSFWADAGGQSGVVSQSGQSLAGVHGAAGDTVPRLFTTPTHLSVNFHYLAGKSIQQPACLLPNSQD
jgi:hypothetical protein